MIFLSDCILFLQFLTRVCAMLLLQCPNKAFESWLKCRKHMAALHSGKEFRCEFCEKVFSRPDKLRLHTLTHTHIKEHMCDTCGRQFARKDKVQLSFV